MDLLEQCGVDTSDWPNYAKGDTAPAANPRYCYNWSFIEPGKVVVLNLWLGNMAEECGRVIHRANYRAEAEANRVEGNRPQWTSRGMALDQAVQAALRENLPVRVIVNDGDRRSRAAGDDEASVVKARKLDDQCWTIAAYDWGDGSCELVRGFHAARVPEK